MRQASLFALVIGCGRPLVGVDGGDDHATSTTGADDDGSASAVTQTAATSADSGGPFDLGGAGAEPTSLCPPASVARVGIDTNVRITFATDAPPVLVDVTPIQLECAGQPIVGVTTTAPGQLVFSPSATLPADAACEVAVTDEAVAIDGVEISALSWSFTTGSDHGLEFDFATPITLADQHSLSELADADGDGVVFLLLSTGMVVARSSDRGDHFELSTLDTVSGSIQMPDLHLQDGIVHVAWQVLDGKSEGQCFYSRSEPGLGEMSEPLHLDAAPPSMTATYPSIATDGDGRVVVTWQEECFFGAPCKGDDGLYMITSDDGGTSFSTPTRVLGRDAWGFGTLYGPKLGWIDGGVAGIWTAYPNGAANGVDFLDGEAGVSVLQHLAGAQQITDFDRTFQNEAGLHWFEFGRDGKARRMLAYVRERTVSGIETPIAIAEPVGVGDFGATVDVHGDLVGVVAIEGEFYGEHLDRHLKLSTDAGKTFSAPQWIDFMLTSDSTASVSDSPIPLIAIADDERAHLAWWHFEDLATSVRYTHGDRIEPCGTKSAE